jgi:hypothetical protein
MFPQDTTSRFWSKVDRSGGPNACWPWLAGINEKGYGRFRMDGKLHRANRVAFFLTHGHWPQTARHTCDNPPCCNPAHIIDGTVQNNNHDAFHRNRDNRRRYSRDVVAEVLERVARGQTQRHVAAVVGVSKSTVNDICNGHTRTTF